MASSLTDRTIKSLSRCLPEEAASHSWVQVQWVSKETSVSAHEKALSTLWVSPAQISGLSYIISRVLICSGLLLTCGVNRNHDTDTQHTLQSGVSGYLCSWLIKLALHPCLDSDYLMLYHYNHYYCSTANASGHLLVPDACRLAQNFVSYRTCVCFCIF